MEKKCVKNDGTNYKTLVREILLARINTKSNIKNDVQ